MDEYYAQILHTIDVGVVIVDTEMNVTQWNHWMEQRSGIVFSDIIGSNLLDRFPNLRNKNFLRAFKTAVRLGSPHFFRQRLYGHLFPLKPATIIGDSFELMRQDCMMFPLRDEDGAIKYVYIAVHDVTDSAVSENRLITTSMRDPLTGAYNRKFLEWRLKQEVERARRYKRPLSIVMADIDHFKKINDTYGHQCGDEVLKGFTKSLTGALRNTDLLVRYGGEEFCCLLPETDCQSTAFVAERLRATIENEAVTYSCHVVNITASFGVCGLEGIENDRDLIRRADEALYEAKKAGRNRVVVKAGAPSGGSLHVADPVDRASGVI